MACDVAGLTTGLTTRVPQAAAKQHMEWIKPTVPWSRSIRLIVTRTAKSAHTNIYTSRHATAVVCLFVMSGAIQEPKVAPGDGFFVAYRSLMKSELLQTAKNSDEF